MMKSRLRQLLLCSLMCLAGWLTGCGGDDAPASAQPSAPDSLVGRRYTITETSGNSSLLLLQNNRYELIHPDGSLETGTFTATRNGNTWNIGATTANGSLTRSLALSFNNAAAGQLTIASSGEPVRVGAFQEASGPPAPPVTPGGTNTPPPNPTGPTNRFAPATLISMSFRNTTSATGPSSYPVQFNGGAAGTFTISPPGYGSGTFTYSPGLDSGRLVLTYTGDIAGDQDDLLLTFKALSGSATPSSHSGSQRVSGNLVSIEGTFTYTGTPP